MRMSSSKKYLIIFAIISLLLIIAVNIYFYERYNNFQENRKQKITKEFHLQKNLLEYRLEEMFASSYLERKVIEKYLIQDENNLLYNDYNYSISNSNGKGIVTLSLDSGSEKGNIVLHKDFAAEIDLKNSQLINRNITA